MRWNNASASSREVKNSTSYTYEELRPVSKRGYSDVRIGEKVRAYSSRVLLCLLALGLLTLSLCLGYGLLIPVSGDDGYCGTDEGPSASILEISVAFGDLSFAEAKFIDAAWNLVVGHGCQFVFTWISYKVFVSSLYRIAENSMVPIESYTDIALFGPQMKSLWSLIKVAVSTEGRRVKANLSFMVFATIFILAWPTLLDVSTGYTPRQTTMLTLDNGYLVPFNYDDWSDSRQAVTFCNQTITAKELWGLDYYGEINPEGPSVNYYGNFPPFTCVPNGRFGWGFSQILLWTSLSLMNLWAWSLFGLWADSFKNSQIYHRLDRPGTYRIILDIAHAITTLMGPRATASSARKLEEEFRRSKMKLKWHSIPNSTEHPTLQAHAGHE